MEESDILCQDQRTERNHPEAQDREKADEPARNEQNRNGNAHQARRWAPQPAQGLTHSRRKLVGDPVNLPIKLSCRMLVTSCGVAFSSGLILRHCRADPPLAEAEETENGDNDDNQPYYVDDVVHRFLIHRVGGR